MLEHKAEFEYPDFKMLVVLLCTSHASVWLEFICKHPQRYAGLTTVAVRPVGEHAATPKSVGHQLRISGVVNQVTWRCHLRASLAARQIAARVGRGGIKLESLRREIFKMGHV